MIDFQSFWRQRGIFNIILYPCSAVFAALAAARRRYLLRRLPKPADATPPLPPIIIVGNIVAGGGGKTPVVIALARRLAARGYHPGIISRGYGGSYRQNTLMVEDSSDWRVCGDEALLIRRLTNAPVCIGRRRLPAAQRLAAAGCDVLISDDGLQHYTLPRTIEICVTNARYRFGNGWHLPAGPLRESIARLMTCDLRLLINGDETQHPADNADMICIQKTVRGIYAHCTQQYCNADFFNGKTVTAVAGIAHPDNFFRSAEQLGITLNAKKTLPDHGMAALSDINTDIILMTEKDAVKYAPTDKRCYILAVECRLPGHLIEKIEHRLQEHPC